LNRLEVKWFIKSFFEGLKNSRIDPKAAELKSFLKLIVSLKRDIPLAIPVLRDLAALIVSRNSDLTKKVQSETGIIIGRINRRYQRLCRIQEELGALDFKKAAPGVSPEDFIFSRIDFSRYRKIDKEVFEELFPAGLMDFDEAFFKKNFSLGRTALQSLVGGIYKKTEKTYTLQRENPLVLSVMRTLETSLETAPLFSAGEINNELQNLLDFVDKGETKPKPLPGTEPLYPLLVSGLDDVHITHRDGMTTRLFASPRGELSGTFRPGGKPWTLVLV